jgi:DNA replication protein DnaC
MNLQTIKKELLRRSALPPEILAAEFARQCPYCGAVMVPEIREVPHPLKEGVVSRLPIFPERHGCHEETVSLAQRAELERYTEEQMKREAWAYALNRAGLVGWLGKATFETFRPRDDWADAMHVCGRVKAYSYALLNDNLNGKPFLILHGAWGTGKTHLAAAIVLAALEAGWNEIYFRVWTEYLSRLQASWNRRRNGDDGETEYDIEAELKDGRLVVIDDLDKRRPTGWTTETLVGVINYRYNAGLPTVLTFNYGPEDFDGRTGKLALVEYLGVAVLDRLIGDTFDTIEFEAPSYRSGVDWRQAA